MRVLLFVEPLIMHNRPFHYWAFLAHFADMANTLRADGATLRVVVNQALAIRALAPRGGDGPRRGHGLPADEVVVLDQGPIRRLFNRPNVAIIAGLHRGAHPRAAVHAYAALVQRSLGDFVPDVVLSVVPAEQLRVAFPAALHLATETSPFSRAPYPGGLFFDPAGMWDRSTPARHAAELLAHQASAAELDLLARFRRRFGEYFAAISPFAPLEAELRARTPRLAFLPLQFGGEPGFDVNAPFRNQGEYLFHVLEALPPDVGLLVVEHPTAHWVGDIIDEETRELVAELWPNVRFVDVTAVESAGQVLLHHADVVISVSSSLAYQALFFGKPLLAVGAGHPFAAQLELERLASPPPADPSLDPALAWLLARYFVPLELVRRPSWLLSRFERGRAAGSPLGFFEPVAAPDDLAALLFEKLDALTPMRGALENGDLKRWSKGPGPFFVGAESADGWHLLDFSGGVAEVRRAAEGHGARLRRFKPGSGPTLFLARVPDAASCAGSLARLRFRARSEERALLSVYLYVQVDDGAAGFGAQAQIVTLTAVWSDFVHLAMLPSLGGRTPGPDSHVEVVFALTPEVGATSIELADVRLEPVAI